MTMWIYSVALAAFKGNTMHSSNEIFNARALPFGNLWDRWNE